MWQLSNCHYKNILKGFSIKNVINYYEKEFRMEKKEIKNSNNPLSARSDFLSLNLRKGISCRNSWSFTFWLCCSFSSTTQLMLYLLSRRIFGIWTELAMRPAPNTPTFMRCFLLFFSTTVENDKRWHFCKTYDII